MLGTYQLQLSNSLGYNSDLLASFTSLTLSCSATDYPVTSPPPNTISQTAIPTPSTTAPVPTKSCASTYTVLKSDDCHSISNEQRISTSNLLYLNGLEAGCTDFPGAGTKLCMPHTCEIYTVKQNDTCFGIVGSYDPRSLFPSWCPGISTSTGAVTTSSSW